MDYSTLVDYYTKIERTTGRKEMTNYLVDLIKSTPSSLLDKVVYLTQGKLYPDYEGIEVGIAEKLAVKALSKAVGADERKILDDLKRSGDVGETAKNVVKVKKQKARLSVKEVYQTLDEIARAKGKGALKRKLDLIADLLRKASPDEVKYLIRTLCGKLRLGIADATIIYALSLIYDKDKNSKELIERAYNLTSDLGEVVRTLSKGGLSKVKKLGIKVGRPLRPMLAERLASPSKILEKLGGRCACEYKYDGERVQIHKSLTSVSLFSRRLENITYQYPDVVELAKKYIRGAKEVICEGECVAVDPETGELRPFQELMHRRRKYGVKEAMKSYPASLFLFDLLYADGKDFTSTSFLKRRVALEKITSECRRIKLTQLKIVEEEKELVNFFEEALEAGCEGLVCKSIAADSLYRAGTRGFQWIKYKREYKSELTDTVDLVIVGAFYGRGKRKKGYGALLLAAYNAFSDTFETVTKCGTGFSDKDLLNLPKLLGDYVITHKHPRVVSKLDADVWFVPKIVIEVLGAEITLSPVHTCAIDRIRKGSGLAIRFPRFTGNFRRDKGPEDATTTEEIVEMYKGSLRKIS